MSTRWSIAELRQHVARLPRFPLTHLPTPLEDSLRLSAALGHKVRLLMKRDDLTSIGLGGNKVRRLEFTIGEALATGCDCIVHGLAGQSNYCRQTAASAARAGLPCYLILRQDHKAEDPPQANRLLDYVFGAHVEMVPPDTQNQGIAALVERLKAAGHKPYCIGSHDEVLGAISYALALAEIIEQSAARGITPDVVAATARVGTLAGLLLGQQLLGFAGRIQAYDIDPRSSLPRWAERAVQMAQDAAALLGATVELSAAQVHNTTDYAGPAYGEASPACLDALLLLGRTEGLLVGPIYAAKGLAGLIDYIRTGRFAAGSTIVFIHTGGITEAFAYNAEIFARLRETAKP